MGLGGDEMMDLLSRLRAIAEIGKVMDSARSEFSRPQYRLGIFPAPIFRAIAADLGVLNIAVHVYPTGIAIEALEVSIGDMYVNASSLERAATVEELERMHADSNGKNGITFHKPVTVEEVAHV
jgi:hypothetical protein